jgi:hypothetical protein
MTVFGEEISLSSMLRGINPPRLKSIPKVEILPGIVGKIMRRRPIATGAARQF